MIFFLVDSFNGGFILDQGHDDFAVSGGIGLLNDGKVPVIDADFDHGFPDDFQDEQILVVLDEMGGDDKMILDVFSG